MNVAMTHAWVVYSAHVSEHWDKDIVLVLNKTQIGNAQSTTNISTSVLPIRPTNVYFV